MTQPRRASTAICGTCGQPISLVSWKDKTVPSAFTASGYKTVEYREYVHDWNGGMDSLEGGRHSAWPKS